MGLSNEDIADTLFISTSTVKAHLRTLYAATGMATRGELQMFCLLTNAVDFDKIRKEFTHKHGL